MEMAFGVPFLVGLLYALGVVRKIEETSGVHVAGTIEIAGPSTSAVACVAESPIDLSLSMTQMGGAARSTLATSRLPVSPDAGSSLVWAR